VLRNTQIGLHWSLITLVQCAARASNLVDAVLNVDIGTDEVDVVGTSDVAGVSLKVQLIVECHVKVSKDLTRTKRRRLVYGGGRSASSYCVGVDDVQYVLIFRGSCVYTSLRRSLKIPLDPGARGLELDGEIARIAYGLYVHCSDVAVCRLSTRCRMGFDAQVIDRLFDVNTTGAVVFR